MSDSAILVLGLCGTLVIGLVIIAIASGISNRRRKRMFEEADKRFNDRLLNSVVVKSNDQF